MNFSHCKHTLIPRFTLLLFQKKKRRLKSKRRKSNFILLLVQSGMFLIENLKKLYEFTVSPRFTSHLVPKKGNLNRMNTQIEVRGKKNLTTLIETTLIEAT